LEKYVIPETQSISYANDLKIVLKIFLHISLPFVRYYLENFILD